MGSETEEVDGRDEKSESAEAKFRLPIVDLIKLSSQPTLRVDDDADNDPPKPDEVGEVNELDKQSPFVEMMLLWSNDDSA